MKRSVLRLVLESYVGCLERRLPPSGKPVMHDLVANLNVLITALPANGGPDVGDLEHLDLDKTKVAVEWLFTSLAAAHSDSWTGKLAAHLGRLLALDAAEEILAGVLSPGHTLGSPQAGQGK